jgi:hypothetical protein
VDVLLVTDNYEKRVMDGLFNAVVSGRVPMKSIDDAYHRIMATKGKYGILAWKPARKKAVQQAKTSDSPLEVVRK